MDYLLRPRIWPSFLASSGVGPCDVPFRGTPRNQYPVVARWHAHPLRARCAPLSPASGFPVAWSRDGNCSSLQQAAGNLRNV